MADDSDKDGKTSDSTIRGALERFKESQDGTLHNRDAAYEDIRFGRLSEQWPEKILTQRKQEGRPALTINKLPPLIRQVVNEARQNKPSITVHPVDNGADKDTAEVISGLIRSIERQGPGAGVAYDTAIDHSVSGGFGFFEIAIDYAHADTFDMECKIRRIANPLLVHWDPNSTEFDASDWEFAFVSDLLTTEQFKKRFPKAEAVSFEGSDMGDYGGDWLTDEKVRIASYWLRTEKTRKLLQIELGDNRLIAVREKDIPGIARSAANGGGLNLDGLKDADLLQAYLSITGGQVRREREVKHFEVKRRTISGVEVLDEEEWPGTTIPICPVWGEEVLIDGKRHFRSMIRDAKDPQTMHNFWRSATTELVALAPRAPWVGAKGFIPKGDEQKWQTANTRSHAYLEYSPVNGAAAPQRQEFAGVPAGALQEAISANEDLHEITGIYPSSIGAKSNETSGKAILTRERQGDISNFHFIDNLSRAIKYAGRVLVEIIPSVYTPRETIRILGADMTEKVVKLAATGGLDIPGPQDPNKERLYDLSIGHYDVEVKTGPSYGTQREETRETLIEIMRAVPDSAAFLGDVLMEHMDFQGADKVAERLKLLLPPQIQAAEGIPVTAPGPVPGTPPIPGAPPAPLAAVPPGNPAGAPAIAA